MKSNVILIVAAVVGLTVAVQFLRYDYIHTTGQLVMRVDRITGASCLLPCQTLESIPSKPVNVKTFVSIGPGARAFDEKGGCRFEAYAGDSFGVIDVMSKGPLPKSGDELVGNFDDLGGSWIQDTTTHSTLNAEVKLRTSDWSGVLDYMRESGCLKPGNWIAFAHAS